MTAQPDSRKFATRLRTAMKSRSCGSPSCQHFGTCSGGIWKRLHQDWSAERHEIGGQMHGWRTTHLPTEHTSHFIL